MFHRARTAVPLVIGLIAIACADMHRPAHAQQPERCTTSEWACDMAGLPFTPVPALTVLSRVLLDDQLACAVQQITVIPCVEGDRRAVCTDLFVADPAAGTIAVARLLIGESVGTVTAATRAVCEIYATAMWGDGSVAAVQRCVEGAR